MSQPAGASTEAPQAPGRGGWLMCRLFGVPVYVTPSWAIVAVLITVMFAPNVGYDIPEIGGGRFAVSFTYAVLLYLSVLIHELGHALVGDEDRPAGQAHHPAIARRRDRDGRRGPHARAASSRSPAPVRRSRCCSASGRTSRSAPSAATRAG